MKDLLVISVILIIVLVRLNWHWYIRYKNHRFEMINIRKVKQMKDILLEENLQLKCKNNTLLYQQKIMSKQIKDLNETNVRIFRTISKNQCNADIALFYTISINDNDISTFSTN
jgi:hypothetical protein